MKVKTAGVGHTPQEIRMTAENVSTKMRGMADDGRVWVRTASSCRKTASDIW